MASGVRVSKLSSCPGGVWNLERRATRVRSSAAVSERPRPGRGRPKMAKPVPRPYMRSKADAGKEGGLHGLADHGHEGAGAVFLAGEEAPVDDADITNVGHIGRGSDDGG